MKYSKYSLDFSGRLPIDALMEIRKTGKMKKGIYIQEYESGKFQVRNEENEVLDPHQLIWRPDYQSDHSFMFFSSKETAEKAIVAVNEKFTVIEVDEFDLIRFKEKEIKAKLEASKNNKDAANSVFLIVCLLITTYIFAKVFF